MRQCVEKSQEDEGCDDDDDEDEENEGAEGSIAENGDQEEVK